MKRCAVCSAPFEGERWQRLCWPCWRLRKDAEAREDAYQRGYIDGLAAGIRRQAIDADLLRDAIALAHPDRHPLERRELATATTAALLDLRRGLAA